MSKPPGHVTVTTEVGYCNFCGRPRNLRREERHLGQLVRTNVTCESCHRTLFSTITVATAEVETVPAPTAEAGPAPAAQPEERPKERPRAATQPKSPPKRAAKRR